MSREVISVPEQTPLREAARLLLLHQISGMPVVEAGGVCIGVISTIDILRWASQPSNASNPTASDRSLACTFQIKDRVKGKEQTLCTLPLGVCPIQRKEQRADGGESVICSQPHSVLADWQVVEVEQLPTESVGQFMTADPVMVSAETPVTELARQMIDGHIHRLIVVDLQGKPIGIVSSTDILAWVAQGGGLVAEEDEESV
jgi:CBS-domain-containing membrane protein